MVGGILQVNNVPPGGSVQWQMQRGEGDSAHWANIEGATGERLSISRDHAGDTVRALVTVHKDGNVVDTDIVSFDGIDPIENTPPTMVKNHPIMMNVNDAPGATTRVHEMVDLNALFEDLDGDDLTFTITGESAGLPSDLEDSGGSYVGGNADHVVSFNEKTGELIYVTDLKNNHDGDNRDGSEGSAEDYVGNIVSFRVTADDKRGGGATAMVDVRLNAAPTTIGHDQRGDGYSHLEKSFESDTLIADLDVLDQNAKDHEYGTHTLTPSDGRFVIKHGGGGKEDDDDDGSTWGLYIKKGTKFDYETEKEIKLEITAVDGGGKKAEVLKLTITVRNDEGEPEDEEGPPANDVPGLVDNDGNSDDTEDDPGPGDGDSDTDGGWKPAPPPGMSVGGLIEDFTDTMDSAGQNVFDDFMLVIDDGLDIA